MQWTGWIFKIFPYDQHSLRFILQDVACVAFSVESLWSCSAIPCSLPAWERHFWREAAKGKEEGSHHTNGGIHLYRFLVDGAIIWRSLAAGVPSKWGRGWTNLMTMLWCRAIFQCVSGLNSKFSFQLNSSRGIAHLCPSLAPGHVCPSCCF